LKIQTRKTKSGIPLMRDKLCCNREAAKSMTGKRASRDGSGEALHLCRKLRNLLRR
jgi:hypothetical protein